MAGSEEAAFTGGFFLANIAWLLAQAFIIGVYFVGAVLMFNVVRHELNAIPATA